MQHECLDNLVEHMVELNGETFPGYSYCRCCGRVYLPHGNERNLWVEQDMNHFNMEGTRQRLEHDSPPRQ